MFHNNTVAFNCIPRHVTSYPASAMLCAECAAHRWFALYVVSSQLIAVSFLKHCPQEFPWKWSEIMNVNWSAGADLNSLGATPSLDRETNISLQLGQSLQYNDTYYYLLSITFGDYRSKRREENVGSLRMLCALPGNWKTYSFIMIHFGRIFM